MLNGYFMPFTARARRIKINLLYFRNWPTFFRRSSNVSIKSHVVIWSKEQERQQRGSLFGTHSINQFTLVIYKHEQYKWTYYFVIVWYSINYIAVTYENLCGYSYVTALSYVFIQHGLFLPCFLHFCGIYEITTFYTIIKCCQNDIRHSLE